MKLDMSRKLEVYEDASFARDWEKSWSDDSKIVMSRTGCVIKYANCPIMWASKLQTKIALSTTEAEYIVLSRAIREAIILIDLLNKVKGSIRVSEDPKVDYKCKVFEDNNGCRELTKCPGIRP
eukprot:2087127-Ditylum_brightwellii.AAC.1